MVGGLSGGLHSTAYSGAIILIFELNRDDRDERKNKILYTVHVK